ncbi:MAG TPA: CBS domain-containing protein [Geobacterales bacterium]|nr:CBS domain-containing protein [Geobacterales bacterium]
MKEDNARSFYDDIKLERFTTKEVYVIGPNDTLAFARKIMLRNNISKLVVVNGDEITGIISLRDIAQVLTKLGTEFNSTLDQILVKKIAKTDIIKLEAEQSVKNACKVMKEKEVGSVVIVKNNKLAGIFTPTDACKIFNEYPIESLKVADAMTKKFETVNKITSVWRVIEKFQRGIDVVLVEDNRKPIGVITLARIAYLEEGEFLGPRVKYIRGSTAEYTRTRVGKTAEDIMYSLDLAINFNDKLQKAVNYMLTYDLPALPVINEFGEIMGIITKRNVVEVMAE